MKIKVMKKHIVNGIQRSNTMCPIAQAIREALKGAQTVRIESALNSRPIRVLFRVRVNGTPYDLPASAVNFIERFDEPGRGAVKPFTFELKEI